MQFNEKPLEAGLWCLYVSKHDFKVDYLSFESMENILSEFLDMPLVLTQEQTLTVPPCRCACKIGEFQPCKRLE